MPAGADVAPSRSDKTCEICGEEIRKSGIACDGENCTVFLHTKCFESIAKLFFTERKNWKCKNCAVKCKSVPTSSPVDIKVLQHEVECLNRENELLINLNSELKSVNELLKEKLKLSPPNSESSSSCAAKTRVLGQGQTSGSTVSYSSTTKNQNMNIKRSAGIMVKANDNSVSTSDVLNDIQKNINPKDLQLRLDGIKKIRNGIIIYCDEDKSLAKLKDHAAHKLGSKYNINYTRLHNPPLLIKDIKTSENSSDADIIENIRSVNNLQDLRDQEIKVVTKLRYPNHIDLVVEVSPELRRFFMAQGYIYAGLSRCNVSDHIRVIRKDRQSRGGGVGIYVRSTIKYEILTCSSDARLEHIFIKFKIGRRSDLNINFLIQDDKVSQCFKSYGLTQVILEPTRITETSSTILDPIFLSEGANCVEKGTINANMLSDHQMFILWYSKAKKIVTFRDYKNFNIDNFNKDLHQVPWDRILYLRDVESKLRFLTVNINMLFDLHCPIRTVRVTRPKAPWLTSNLKLIFEERNRALSKFKNNPSPDNSNNYKSLRNFALMSLRNEKSAFLKHLQHQKNSSLLYKSLKNMHIQANKSIDIPQDLSDLYMVNDYFTSVFQNSDEACTEKIFFYRTNTYLQKNIFSLKLVSLDNIQTIIHSIKSNASGMDGITLKMLKLCFPAVGIYLLHIISICLEKGYFPEQWKTAVVTPLPKISNPTSLLNFAVKLAFAELYSITYIAESYLALLISIALLHLHFDILSKY
nr:unnamed protein product [Callosobruchus chinensis]